MNHGTEGMDDHKIYHLKGDVIWAMDPKAKHEIMRGQWGRELKDVNIQELLKLFKKTFMPAQNVFDSRAQFFNVKQEDGETLDDYWKRLVDIERNCEFNQKMLEKIITYKFAALYALYSLLRYRKNPKVELNWRTRGDTLRFFIHSVANHQNKLKERHFW